MDTYKIGTDIDKVNITKIGLIYRIIELDGLSVDHVHKIEDINILLINLIRLLNNKEI